MNRTSTAAGLLAALLASAPAPAAATPGNGIRLGGSEGRLHPYLDVEGRWDSNVYYTGASTLADVVVHIRPGFTVKVPGDLVAVDLDAKLDWAQYLGIDDPVTKDLSRAYAAALLGLTLNRRGAVGLELDDEFRRTPDTSVFSFDGAVVTNSNLLTARVPWRPGGGALVLALTGAWKLETYEPFGDCAATDATSCDPQYLKDVSFNELRGGAEVRWRFLPRTSAVFEGSWFSHVPNDTTVAPEISGLDGRAGFSGLVTPHLGATVKAGYMDTLTSTPGAWGTWLATIEGEWLASDAATVRVGWNHGYGIDPSNVLSLYASNRVLAALRYTLAGRYGARLDLSWERRDYAFVSDQNGDLLRVEPTVEAALSRWLNLTLGYAYTSRSSTFSTATAAGFDYSKNEAWLRLVATY
jgi:hypothetical protein